MSPGATPARDGVRFELLERLGKGASGTVWRARMYSRHGLCREVALKIADGAEETVLRRLRDEARLLGLIRHHGLVAVQDLVHLEDDTWGLVMEVLDGVDLLALRALGPIPRGVLLEIGREVADVLDRAYNATDLNGVRLELMHRDIKPANVMLCSDGRVKVLDFGIATARASWRESSTQVGELWGTPAYMPPERHMGSNHANSDIYSLGVMLYQLWVGQRLGRVVMDLREHGLRLEDARDKLIAAHAPPSAATLLIEMMAFDPAERPSAREVVERLDPLRAQEPDPTLSRWANFTVSRVRANLEANTGGPELSTRVVWARESELTLAPTRKPRTSPPPEPEKLVSPEETPAEAEAGSLASSPPRRATLIGGTLGVLALALLSVFLGRPWMTGVEPERAEARAEAQARDTQLHLEVESSAPIARQSEPPVEPRARPTRTFSTGAERRARAPALEPAAPQVVEERAEPSPEPPAPAVGALPEASAAVVADQGADHGAAEPRGAVVIRGDQLDLVAVSTEGRYPLPGALPAGVYELQLRSGVGAPAILGRIRVVASRLLKLRCDAAVMACEVLP